MEMQPWSTWRNKRVRTIQQSAFSPQHKTELKSAVATCLESSPQGDCSTGTHGPIGEWDVSRVTAMTAGDIAKWDVSSVTDMSSMFDGASSFDKDISS